MKEVSNIANSLAHYKVELQVSHSICAQVSQENFMKKRGLRYEKYCVNHVNGRA